MFNSLQEFFSAWNLKPYIMSLCGCTFETSCACSELGNFSGILPELVLIGQNSFWADAGRVTMVDFEGNQIVIKRSRFPQNFFVGNSAIVEAGSHPSNYLVGVGTVAPAGTGNRRQMQSRLDVMKTIFGNPPLPISAQRTSRFTDADGGEEEEEEGEEGEGGDPSSPSRSATLGRKSRKSQNLREQFKKSLTRGSQATVKSAKTTDSTDAGGWKKVSAVNPRDSSGEAPTVSGSDGGVLSRSK